MKADAGNRKPYLVGAKTKHVEKTIDDQNKEIEDKHSPEEIAKHPRAISKAFKK